MSTESEPSPFIMPVTITTTKMINQVSVSYPIIYGVFSAALGAVFIKLLDKTYTRIRIKQAIFRELESNKRILHGQIESIESDANWDGRTTESFHTDAYATLRVNDPVLFFKMRERWPSIFECYLNIKYLNDLKQASFVGEVAIPKRKRAGFLSDLKEMDSELDSLLNELDGYWFLHSLNAPLYELDRSQRLKTEE